MLIDVDIVKEQGTIVYVNRKMLNTPGKPRKLM
jgi:hypothetical protein